VATVLPVRSFGGAALVGEPWHDWARAAALAVRRAAALAVRGALVGHRRALREGADGLARHVEALREQLPDGSARALEARIELGDVRHSAA